MLNITTHAGHESCNIPLLFVATLVPGAKMATLPEHIQPPASSTPNASHCFPLLPEGVYQRYPTRMARTNRVV